MQCQAGPYSTPYLNLLVDAPWELSLYLSFHSAPARLEEAVVFWCGALPCPWPTLTQGLGNLTTVRARSNLIARMFVPWSLLTLMSYLWPKDRPYTSLILTFYSLLFPMPIPSLYTYRRTLIDNYYLSNLHQTLVPSDLSQ